MYPELRKAPVEVRTADTSGRGLYAKEGKLINRGSTVLRASPHVAVLSLDAALEHCWHCGIHAADLSIALKTCKGCDAAKFCSVVRLA